jgi:hypothetical protein
MSKIEKLTEIAGQLTEDQVEGLIHYAQTLLEEPFLNRAPPEVLEDIRIGIEQADRGETVDAKVVFTRLKEKIEASRK